MCVYTQERYVCMYKQRCYVCVCVCVQATIQQCYVCVCVQAIMLCDYVKRMQESSEADSAGLLC